MEEKNKRLPLSEGELNNLVVTLGKSEELRIMVRFLMKQDDSDLHWLRQTLIGFGMINTLRTFRICSQSFSELNQ